LADLPITNNQVLGYNLSALRPIQIVWQIKSPFFVFAFFIGSEGKKGHANRSCALHFLLTQVEEGKEVGKLGKDSDSHKKKENKVAL
jgi:hypothetical protein